MTPAQAYNTAALRAAPRTGLESGARETAALGLLVGAFGLLMPVMRYFNIAGSNVNVSAGDLLLIPALVAMGGRLLRIGSLGAWLLALWLVHLLSWMLSLSLLEPVVFGREVVKLATCYLYAAAGFAIGQDRRTHDAFVKGLLIAAIPMAALGITAFFTRFPGAFIVESRVAGTLADPNAFGVFLAMALPLTASLKLSWTIAPIFIGAAIVSFSRTGLLAVGISAILSSLHLGLRRSMVIVISAACVFAVVWGAATSSRGVGVRVIQYQASLEGRQALWGRAAAVAASHPFFGVGKGNWPAASGIRTLPHNTFLSVMVDGGALGFAVFMIPLTVWLWRGFWRRGTRPWSIAVFAGLVGGLAISLDNFRLFWTAVGVLVALLALEAEASRSARALQPNRRAASGFDWS